MRLLRTKTLEFEDFLDSQLPVYAILSHRWGEHEVSYKEMRGFQKEHLAATNEERYKAAEASGLGMAKIKNFCQKASSNGFDWGWIDTCCIDKRSSAELSESINAMFKWYARSSVCYIYLSDFEFPVHEQELGSEHDIQAWYHRIWPTMSPNFKASAWFTRGWTLQELLAPKTSQISFLDGNWTLIGHLSDLLDDVSAATGIAKMFLTEMGFRNQQRQAGVSIARIMSWASRRNTSREEDVAYCLLGLFNVHMPLLYGEGAANAFHRLQVEIMKESDDESLFAWTSNREFSGLLAPSPACFANSENILTSRYAGIRPPYSMTNKGLALSVPRLHLPEMEDNYHLFRIYLNCFRPPDGYQDSQGSLIIAQHPISLLLTGIDEGASCRASRRFCDVLESSEDLTLHDLNQEFLHGETRVIHVFEPQREE
ncbi:MAG: hypothetical protein Q9205_007560 [Flavoplaca limonia]